MRTLLSLLLLSLFAALLACSPSENSTEPTHDDTNSRAAPNNATESEPEPPRMIQPGEATRDLNGMTFGGRILPDSADGVVCEQEPCIVTDSLCRLLGPFPDSFAILEMVDIQSRQTAECSKYRNHIHTIYQFKTLAVVAGKELPEDLSAVAYECNLLPPQVGDIVLLQLHQIGEEWFAGGDPATLHLDTETIDPTPTQSEGVAIQFDLPPSFEDLTIETNTILDNYEECRKTYWSFWTSPAKYDAWLTTPGDPRCGFPEYPPDAPDSSSTEAWYRQFER